MMIKPTYTPEFCEAQYNVRAGILDPSQFDVRRAEMSRKARLTLPCYLDVAYGDGPNETLDIFPAHGKSRALLSFIHGGYWRSRDKADFSFIAPPFVERDVTVAIVNYALTPAVTIEAIVRQMLAAHVWLYRNCGKYGAPRERMYVSGHSAGGHLTAMMLAAVWSAYAQDVPDDLVKGGLAVSGLYDLKPLLHVSFNSDLRLDAQSVRKLSPVNYSPLRAVPLYTCVGGLESNEFKRQNRLIAGIWKHCFKRDIAMPECHHLNVIEQLSDPNSALLAGALEMMGLGRDAAVRPATRSAVS